MVLSRGYFVQETVPCGQSIMGSWCGEETRRVTNPDNSVKKEYI